MARPGLASLGRLACALACVTLGVVAPLRAAETIRFQGSALVLERLVGLLDLPRHLPDVSVEWRGDGTGAAFVSLFDGSADVAVSSRPMEERERRLASRLSLQLRQYPLALDGVAVIVHPGNPIESLSLGQLATLFAGRIVAWHGVAGPNLDVRLLVPPPSSGTHSFVIDRILGGRPIGASAETTETDDAAEAAVASDPRAIALVSMSRDRSTVKTVPVKADDSSPASLPTFGSVALEEYPLTRELWLYVRGEPDDRVHRVLSFLLSSEGQAKVRASGLVPIFADRPIQRALASRGPTGRAPLVSALFSTGASRLDREARTTLDRTAARALEHGVDVWITGHSDAREDRHLSEERARVVESYLTGLGVKAVEVESLGAAEPILLAVDSAAVASPEGPRAVENRRVDVWILARR
jgi:phosphate transport system substrate-binding protein